MARYGQRPETEKQYRDAILSCMSIEHLELTVTDIARKHDVKPECLRNQLKRHFPEIIPKRERIRNLLGCSRPGNKGLKIATVEKYSESVQMLRETSLTIRQVAFQCDVSYRGLQQHLLFYHKDIAESRMLFRTDALLQAIPCGESRGTPSATGGLRRPRAETEALYEPAVKMFQETDCTLTQIAARCGVKVHTLAGYLARWYPDSVEKRRMEREAKWAAKKQERMNQPDRSVSALARQRYTPAIALLRNGMTLSQAANSLGVDLTNLSAWFRKNHPEVLEETKAGMMILPSGEKTLRRTYERYLPIAEYITTHPAQSTRYLAEKFHVPESSLVRYISKYFPLQWQRHCKACARKAERLRKHNKKK